MLPCVRSPIAPPLWPDAFDKRVKSAGDARSVVGKFFEGATSSLLGLPSLRTDCRIPLCPDFAASDATVYHEVKATGAGKVLIYQTSLLKYREAAKSGIDVVHWVWVYRIQNRKNLHYISCWNNALSQCSTILLLVPLDVLTLCTETHPIMCLNRSVKTSANRTGMGWDLPVTKLMQRPIIYSGKIENVSSGEHPLTDITLHDLSLSRSRVNYVCCPIKKGA